MLVLKKLLDYQQSVADTFGTTWIYFSPQKINRAADPYLFFFYYDTQCTVTTSSNDSDKDRATGQCFEALSSITLSLCVNGLLGI